MKSIVVDSIAGEESMYQSSEDLRTEEEEEEEEEDDDDDDDDDDGREKKGQNWKLAKSGTKFGHPLGRGLDTCPTKQIVSITIRMALLACLLACLGRSVCSWLTCKPLIFKMILPCPAYVMIDLTWNRAILFAMIGIQLVLPVPVLVSPNDGSYMSLSCSKFNLCAFIYDY